jgi:hypothetical protein
VSDGKHSVEWDSKQAIFISTKFPLLQSISVAWLLIPTKQVSKKRRLGWVGGGIII